MLVKNLRFVKYFLFFKHKQQKKKRSCNNRMDGNEENIVMQKFLYRVKREFIVIRFVHN